MNEKNEVQMSPDDSPGVKTKKIGVRRVNNLPIIIILCIVVAFGTVMAIVAIDRAAKQNKSTGAKSEEKKAGSTDMYAQALAGDKKSGLIPREPEKAKPLDVPEMSDQTKPNPQDQTGKTDGEKSDKKGPPLPSSQLGQQTSPANDEAMRIKKVKIQQLEEAIKAKTTVQTVAPRSPGSSPLASGRADKVETPQNTADTYQARLQMLKSSGILSGGGGTAGGQAPKLIQAGAEGAGKDYGQFGNASHMDRWKLDEKPEPPRSPYELRAGFVIPALLISGINSDLPGQIMGQVSQDIYDTPTGKWKLIPQGTRLVGSYSSSVAYGQARVLVAWQRIVFPDGKAMDIGAMPGADSAGYAGFNDQVNNHYIRLFSSAILMSAVTAGVTMSQPQQTGIQSQQNAGSAMSEALGQQLGQVTAQLISKNMNISPTLEIRPGYRFNVIVTKDLTFSKPYQAFDY